MRSLRAPLPILVLLMITGCWVGEKIDRGGFDRIGDGPEICGPAGSSVLLLSSGFLQGATHLDCTPPDSDSAVTTRFTSAEGQESAVNGGSVAMDWSWSGADSIEGRFALLEVQGEEGYSVVPLVPAPDPIVAELFIRQDAAPGLYTIRIAIDDGSGQIEGPPILDEETGEELGRSPVMNPGPWLEFELEVIEVQGGDIQISASWTTNTDVDLHVIDPSGEEIFYGHPLSASGGELDLDSNAACSPGPRLENVYWATGEAPPGTYEVRLAYWSACGVAGTTDWRVTVVLGGSDIEVHSGSFEAIDEDPSGSGELVTLITWED